MLSNSTRNPALAEHNVTMHSTNMHNVLMMITWNMMYSWWLPRTRSHSAGITTLQSSIIDMWICYNIPPTCALTIALDTNSQNKIHLQQGPWFMINRGRPTFCWSPPWNHELGYFLLINTHEIFKWGAFYKSMDQVAKRYAVLNAPFFQISRSGYWKENLETRFRQITEVH